MTTHKNPVGFGPRNLMRPASCVLVMLLALMTVDFRWTNVAHAADGDLDPSFGEGGRVVTDFSDNLNWVNDVKVQPDGKIVVAGAAFTGSFRDSNLEPSFALARYNEDGSLDSSFGNEGRVVTDAGGLKAAWTLALQPDGKILVAGSTGATDDVTSNTDFALARYNNTNTSSFDICI